MGLSGSRLREGVGGLRVIVSVTVGVVIIVIVVTVVIVGASVVIVIVIWVIIMAVIMRWLAFRVERTVGEFCSW